MPSSYSSGPSEKSMGSYVLFAWRDAMEMASWLEADFDVRAVRRAFEELSAEAKTEYEHECLDLITELLRKTPAQRPAYLRKIGKKATEVERGLLVAFAIVALVRVRDLIEIRDRYRTVLAPGQGNRVTCASLFAFQMEVAAMSEVEWPDEVFDAYGGDGGFDDDVMA